jgi:HSP20 family protein
MALLPVSKKSRGELARLRSDMDDLFNAFFGDWDITPYERKLWPAVDIVDSEDSIVVKAELPGCKAGDIDISVHGNTLTLSGEKKQAEEKKEKGYYYKEVSYGSFRRDINLPTKSRLITSMRYAKMAYSP